jgi:hypothetical protein
VSNKTVPISTAEWRRRENVYTGLHGFEFWEHGVRIASVDSLVLRISGSPQTVWTFIGSVRETSTWAIDPSRAEDSFRDSYLDHEVFASSEDAKRACEEWINSVRVPR